MNKVYHQRMPKPGAVAQERKLDATLEKIMFLHSKVLRGFLLYDISSPDHLFENFSNPNDPEYLKQSHCDSDERDHQFVVSAGRGGKVWTVFPDVSESCEGGCLVEEASIAESGALHSADADCSYTKHWLCLCLKLTHQNVSPVFSASGDISKR